MRRGNLRKLGSRLFCSAGLVALASAAHAQAADQANQNTSSAGSAAAPAASTAPDTASSSAPGDIIVTAQRREQRLQDVPISVTALSGETLKNANITDATRLEQLTPGLRIGKSGSDARPAMRGTFTESIQANGDPRIGFYIDDIYQSRTAQALAAFVDLDRVEVQKGPQGTLYGRNSFGGNIAIYTATPKDSFSAGLDGLYGNYNRARLEGYVNAPITDGVAARIAGMYERQDGYIKNICNCGGSDLGDQNQYYFRGSLRIAPASLDDRLEIILRGSYWHQGGHGEGGFGYKSIGTLVDAPLIRAPGGSVTVNGVAYTFPNGFNGSSFSGLPAPYNTRFRDGVADINGADIGVFTPASPYQITSDTNAVRRVRDKQFSGHVSYDFGPATFRSITGYSDFYAYRTTDSDFTPAPYAIDYFQTRAKTFTQEVQLLGSDKSSPFQWIVGGYYLNDDVREISGTEQNRNYSTAIAQANKLPVLYNFSFNYFPQTNCSVSPNDCIAQYRSDGISPVLAKTKSYAAYGQVSYTFFDKLTITGGVRYTSDVKHYAAALGNGGAVAPAGSTTPGFYDYDVNQVVNFACNQTSSAGAGSNASNAGTALITRCGDKTFNFVTYRGAVDYKFDRDHMVYASVATGRHSGGFNNALNASTNTLIPFAPERVTAYELGTKNQFADGKVQLNVTAFFNRYSNLQVQTSIPNPANPSASVLSLLTNGGRNDTYGVEVESILRPTRELTINLALDYLHAREKNYTVNIFSYGFCAQTGACPSTSLSTLGVQGTPFPNPVTDPGRFVPVLGSNGQQIVVGGVPQYVYVIAGTGSTGQTYTSKVAFTPALTMNAGLAYDIDFAGGRLTPSVQTYFNSGYILTDLTPNFGNQKAYTKTDLRLTYTSADERFSLQAYVENVENNAVIVRVAYGANRSLNGIYSMPRTYGIKAGYRF